MEAKDTFLLKLCFLLIVSIVWYFSASADFIGYCVVCFIVTCILLWSIYEDWIYSSTENDGYSQIFTFDKEANNATVKNTDLSSSSNKTNGYSYMPKASDNKEVLKLMKPNMGISYGIKEKDDVLFEKKQAFLDGKLELKLPKEPKTYTKDEIYTIVCKELCGMIKVALANNKEGAEELLNNIRKIEITYQSYAYVYLKDIDLFDKYNISKETISQSIETKCEKTYSVRFIKYLDKDVRDYYND